MSRKIHAEVDNSSFSGYTHFCYAEKPASSIAAGCTSRRRATVCNMLNTETSIIMATSIVLSTLLFSLFSSLTFAQTPFEAQEGKIDGLITELDGAEDTLKVNILNELSRELEHHNSDRSLSYAIN
jgi:hypothetical protein